MNIKSAITEAFGSDPAIQLNDIDVDPKKIQAILINEVVPADPQQDFYAADSAYFQSAQGLFREAGLEISSIEDLLEKGIYLTNAVKTPKAVSAVSPEELAASLPYLEAELALFPHVKVIMLMGDVAKKAFNTITREHTMKNVVPAVSTYKLRDSELYYGKIRVLPSYIMTGQNLVIETSKSGMIAEDLAKMLELLD